MGEGDLIMTDDPNLGHEGQIDRQSDEHGGHESHHKHHVRLAVETHSGTFSHDFQPHDLLQYVADLAAEHFHMTLPPGDVWELHHGERLLNLNDTIGQSHLHSGEKLTLTPHEYCVHLIVETVSGIYAHDFRPQDLVQHVANLAAEHFQIALPPGDVWQLQAGERLLNLNETIHEARLHSGEKLVLTAHARRIHLTIQTLSGNYSHDFNPEDLLQYVVDETVKHLNMVLPPGEVWELHHGEDLLNLADTIRQAHLHSGEKLKLAPHEGGGG
jgi:hypothetical protein